MTSRPHKRFAQHWLRSENVLNQIIDAAQLTSSDRILEIGPGTGILTRRLLPEVESVTAVEIDRDLCRKLARSLGDIDNFLLLQADILSLDLAANLAQFPRFQHPNKVVANIPYNITSPILEYLLGTISHPAGRGYQLIVLLVQKEVAERLVAKPGSKTFGVLSLGIQYLAACEWICDVPARAFYPPPKVDSAVIRLSPRIQQPAPQAKQLESLIKMGFANRRKMLRNNLKGVIEAERLSELLQRLNLNPQCRAEELSLSDWLALSNQLSSVDL